MSLAIGENKKIKDTNRVRGALRRVLATLAVGVAAGPLMVQPTAAADTTWFHVSAGFDHTCGVTSTNDLWCWGNNYYGQLGVGDQNHRSAPVRVDPRGKWIAVSSGQNHTCGIQKDYSLYCWGDNRNGILGTGTTAPVHIKPTLVGRLWWAVSAGSNHTCGLRTSGEAYCWGSGHRGQIGSGENIGYATSPQRVAFNGNWAAISAGLYGTCGLDTKGTRYCWGNDMMGGLGLGTQLSITNTPTKLPEDSGWASIDLGELYAGCGVSQGKYVYCWGYNNNGKLGVGDEENRYEPTRTLGGGKWIQVTMGAGHTCGLKTSGSVYCWGNNRQGQLGIGTSSIDESATPVSISGGGSAPQWSALSAGNNHTCGIRSDGILLCWGNNHKGQLGVGDTAIRRSPTKVI